MYCVDHLRAAMKGGMCDEDGEDVAPWTGRDERVCIECDGPIAAEKFHGKGRRPKTCGDFCKSRRQRRQMREAKARRKHD